jgi:hypothetical protein
LNLSGVFPLGIFAIFFSDEQGAGLLHQHPNLEEQVIFDQGFLPLLLDTPVSNSKAAALVLVHLGYFISTDPQYLVSNPLSATGGGT